ncbi:MAG: tetratricopeptide repeat protein [Bacillus sp. (in: Bacteria)]|nr:tetratricopeptide repeat protein [Bacillus sp. (in: firmicutes)]
MEKLRHINEGEHRLILEMYQLADRVELDYKAREPFLSFVKTHCDSLFVAAFAIKMISFEEEAELLEQLIQYTMEQHPEQDYFKLIGAGALVKVKKYEVAMALLESVSVRKSFDYFYLKGRIAFEQYNYKAAISSFREALNIEPDHYHTWSYLGISYLNLGDMETALYYSTISIDINKNDDWNRLNHGIILSDRQNYQEARIVFSEILRSFKNHVPSWIERARCDVALNKLHQAVRGLKTAKSLMPDLPSTYIELANIYWGNYSDGVGAVQELKEGIDQAGKQYPLLVRLGEIFEDQGDFAEAKVWYEEAWQQSPNESYSFLSITRVLSELSGVREGLEHLLSGEKSFVGDCQFLINGGKWLFENGEIGEHRELALTWLETGMDLADSNEPEAWDMYVGLIEDSSYCDRGRSFFAKLLKEKHESNIELVTYIGYLFEREMIWEMPSIIMKKLWRLVNTHSHITG